MVQAEGERQRVAVLVRQRDQTRMAATSRHGRRVSPPGRRRRPPGRDGLITTPPDDNPASMADAVYLVRDLLFDSRINEAADHFGIPAQGTRNADALAAAAHGARLVIIDLGHADAMRALELLASDPATADLESFGFVGHAELEVMDAAKALGCKRVLARGQLAAELPRIFGRLKGVDMG